MSAVLLFSGGLDSLCAWFVLGKLPALTFYLPVPCGVKDFAAAKSLAKMLEMDHRTDTLFADLGWVEPQTDGSHPLRFMPLAARAAKAGYDEIWLAAPLDRSPAPAHSLETVGGALSSVLGRGVEVVSPFPRLDKGERVAQALAHGASPQQLLRSSSCPSADSGHCGACRKCVEKAEAFRQNGVEWPEGYFRVPIETEYLAGVTGDF